MHKAGHSGVRLTSRHVLLAAFPSRSTCTRSGVCTDPDPGTDTAIHTQAQTHIHDRQRRRHTQSDRQPRELDGHLSHCLFSCSLQFTFIATLDTERLDLGHCDKTRALPGPAVTFHERIMPEHATERPVRTATPKLVKALLKVRAVHVQDLREPRLELEIIFPCEFAMCS